MTKNKSEPILIIRAKGPATENGKISLEDLITLGKNVQAAVQRAALVLAGHQDSGRPGRRPQDIKKSCALEVVAMNQGSFEIGFDLPREQFEPMDLGVEAVEKLLEGIDQIGSNGSPLPAGYDTGVLRSLKGLGGLLGRGITEIEAESKTQRLKRNFSYNQEVQRQVIERIHGPVSSLRTVEGRLLMADFRQNSEKCRIHPPAAEPIVCEFDESLEETVCNNLRNYVRITGETKENPDTGRITSIKIQDIEPLTVEGDDFERISAEDFWQDKSLEQLASEQSVQAIGRLEDVLGKGSDLWADDEDFDQFLQFTKGLEHREA